MKCGRCGKELRAGDTAYEQEDKKIEVKGKKVTVKKVKVIVCEACA
jgi:YgiT-type zinc finger domain-containing protein